LNFRPAAHTKGCRRSATFVSLKLATGLSPVPRGFANTQLVAHCPGHRPRRSIRKVRIWDIPRLRKTARPDHVPRPRLRAGARPLHFLRDPSKISSPSKLSCLHPIPEPLPGVRAPMGARTGPSRARPTGGWVAPPSPGALTKNGELGSLPRCGSSTSLAYHKIL
jgi:hypothetical protein